MILDWYPLRDDSPDCRSIFPQPPRSPVSNLCPVFSFSRYNFSLINEKEIHFVPIHFLPFPRTFSTSRKGRNFASTPYLLPRSIVRLNSHFRARALRAYIRRI